MPTGEQVIPDADAEPQGLPLRVDALEHLRPQIQSLLSRMDTLEKKLASLDGDTADSFADVGTQLGALRALIANPPIAR